MLNPYPSMLAIAPGQKYTSSSMFFQGDLFSFISMKTNELMMDKFVNGKIRTDVHC